MCVARFSAFSLFIFPLVVFFAARNANATAKFDFCGGRGSESHYSPTLGMASEIDQRFCPVTGVFAVHH